MALLVAETFEKYASLTEMSSNDNQAASPTAWTADTSGAALTTAAGRYGGKAWGPTQGASSGARQWDVRIVPSGSTLIIQGAIYWDSSGGGNPVIDPILRVQTSGGSDHWSISMAYGSLFIKNAAGTTVATVFMALLSDTWHYLEVKCSQLDSGTITVKLDGITVVNAVAGDFRQGTGNTSLIESVKLLGNQDEFRWEDILIMDGSGGAFDDFKGEMRFESTVPDADGSTTQWTPSAGSNFQCIDDALGAQDADTTYISEATTDDINLASHANIVASNATTIHFAKLSALARADVAGDKIALVCQSGATTATGVDIPLINPTYRWRNEFFRVDPNTSAAWTVSNINSAEWGVKKRV